MSALIAPATSVPSLSGASSANHTVMPSSANRSQTLAASRVLPTPPSPTSVTQRSDRSERRRASVSRCLPTNDDRKSGTLPPARLVGRASGGSEPGGAVERAGSFEGTGHIAPSVLADGSAIQLSSARTSAEGIVPTCSAR